MGLKFKHWLVKSVKVFGGWFGVEISVSRKREGSNYAMVDKNALEAIYRKDSYMRLYEVGLYKTDMVLTDNLFKQCRSYTLQQMLRNVLQKGMDGNVAECGCWKGHSSFIISTILKEFKFTGKFSIFDSFEGGLSDKQPEDANVRYLMSPEELKKEKLNFSSLEDDLHAALNDFDFYKLYKGWIPDRFDEVADQEFIFVHLDVDLYQPTLDGLEFFYPRLKKGGVIVVDDYGYSQFPGAKRSVDDFLSNQAYGLFHASLTGGCFIVK